MTSTKIYQGMDSDSKPSSRVLAPPGGGSSNIFGGAEPVAAPAKREQPAVQKPVSEPIVPQQGQGERAVKQLPKQGEDLFLDNSGLQCWKKGNAKSEYAANVYSSSSNTYDHLFGGSVQEDKDNVLQQKPSRLNDSFGRLFGVSDTRMGSTNTGSLVDSAVSKLDDLSFDYPFTNSPSRSVNPDSSNSLDDSFQRVFGHSEGGSTPTRKITLKGSRNAFNPITGEPIGPSPKQVEEEERKKKEEAKSEKENAVTATTKAPERSSTRVAQPPGGKSSGPLW